MGGKKVLPLPLAQSLANGGGIPCEVDMDEKIPRDPKTSEEIIQRVSCALKNGQCSLEFVRTAQTKRKGYKITHICRWCGFKDREWYTNY